MPHAASTTLFCFKQAHASSNALLRARSNMQKIDNAGNGEGKQPAS